MAKLGPARFNMCVVRGGHFRVFGVIMRALLLVVGAILTLVPAPAVAQSSSVQITEWTVPWEKTRPRDPFVDASGNVWFVGQTGNYVAHLDPRTGAFKRLEIDSGTYPHNLVIDAGGNVWLAGNRNGRLVKMNSATGARTNYHIPGMPKSDPHTMVFNRIGDMWFTMQGTNAVGHFAAKTGKITLVPLPVKNSRPYGIVLDLSDHPWFVEFGSNKVGTVDPATMKLTEHLLPNERTRARRIEVTSDGSVWYGDYTRGVLAKFDPRTGKSMEWPMPSGASSLPYAMATDDRGIFWLVETGIQPNRVVAFDSKSERWVHNVPISQSGGLTVRHMVFHKPTRTLWFGTDANTIGRVAVP